MRDGKLVEKHLAAPLQSAQQGVTIIGEIQAFVSPIDGTLIDSRAKLREHCRMHEVVPTAELKGLPPKLAAQEYTLSKREQQERREFIAHQVNQKFRR